MCWKEKLDGYLFWAVNYWTKDPWKNPMVYPKQNGNGTFYYPGKNGPITSIRFEALRDGMEDYEYLYILDELLKKIKQNSKIPDAMLAFAKNLRDIHPAIVSSVISYTGDEWLLYYYRILLGETIQYLTNLSGKAGENNQSPAIVQAAIDSRQFDQKQSLKEAKLLFDFSKQKNIQKFNGGVLKEKSIDPSGNDNNFMHFVLTRFNSKLVCEYDRLQDWSSYKSMFFEVINNSSAHVKLMMLINSANGNKWEMEILIRKGDRRRVNIELPTPYIDTKKIKKIAFYVWKPEIKNSDVMVGNIYLLNKKNEGMKRNINEYHLF
jgi:hypothetical protein